MKQFFLALLLLPYLSFSQTFFVEKTDSRTARVPVKVEVENTINYIITQKLIDLGKKVTAVQSESDYIVTPILTRKSGYGKAAKGYISFKSTISQKEVLRSKQDKGMRNMFQGMKNPFVLCFDRIITKQFPSLLPRLENAQ
mgnify:FL=1|tara:strand:+ start:580 stop:1002 length:423 start_codon:yes stop_codon:yes gene_type:complete